MTDERIYFVISSAIGEYIIPLVYQYRCIEQIYIYCSDDSQKNAPWITRFPKIRGDWTDCNSLFTAIYDDIQLILSRSSLWSNEELIDRCHTQTLIDSSRESLISLNLLNVEKYSTSNKQIHIVILHCDNNILFSTDSQRFHLSEFSDVVKCIEYLGTTNIRSVFFIISGEIKNIIRHLTSIPMLKDIYAIYCFVPTIHEQELNEVMLSYKNIGRLFDNLQVLLNCLTANIKFYLEQPLHIPAISVFTSQNSMKDKSKLPLTDKKQQMFVAFQLFVKTLRERSIPIGSNQHLYDRCRILFQNESDGEHTLKILETNKDKIFDWFVNMPFLSAIINTFLQESFPQNLLHIQQILMTIDQRFAEASPTTSFSVVYRVQLICEQDLKTIQENVEELVAFHTYLMATHDLLTARTIARQAAARGLLVIIFQIKISTQAHALKLNNNRLLFRFGTIFCIQSVNLAPDNVWYAALAYADLDFQSVQERLQVQVGEKLTWLTFGNYLNALNHFHEAKCYYDYLLSTLSDNHEARSSIYNNMGLMFAQSGDNKQAIKYYNLSMNLLNEASANTDHRSGPILSKTLSQSTETETAVGGSSSDDGMSGVHPQQSRREEALECYRKALELTSDPLLRLRFELKIKDILSS
jgi:tetratricopeptide (TPR) repeat protein